ncbi:Protein phosphatase 1 regulatory subunit 3D [Tulasnella sp. 332]|nr:Protein phosphatase 1 regulatory subunit 3D [Tulasnella sp. 332]
MPYLSPSSSSSVGDTAVLSMQTAHAPTSPTSPPTRNHRRSFTDEHGLGAFTAITGLPKRRSHASLNQVGQVPNQQQPAQAQPQTQSGGRFAFPAKLETANLSAKASAGPSTPVSVKSPKFQLRGSEEDEDSDDDSSDDNHRPGSGAGATTNITQALIPSNADDDNEASNATQIPFPTLLSPTATRRSPPPLTNVARSSSSPQIHSPIITSPSNEHLPPSIYRSPHLSGPRNDPPSTRRSAPLKPALKSNHSSPHLPSLAHQRSLTQSAPSTPNLAKTAWLAAGGASPPGSGASSPGSAFPTTPKSVHFASEKSSLESVVVFTKSARPRSLSNPLEPDTETETEKENGSTWGEWGGRGGGYPFPSMAPSESMVALDGLSLIPAESAIGMNGFGATVPGVDAREKKMVYLETLNLPQSRPPVIRGSVLVRNLAFQKRVAVRFTLDDWQTTSEVSSTYSASLPSLPPPFFSSSANGLSSSSTSGHSRAATVSGGVPSAAPTPDRWDRFSFTIKLEDMERSLSTKKIFLVVRYTLPSQWGWESGGEWWDNNDGMNYSAGFKMVAPAPPPAGRRNVAQAKQNGGDGSKPAKNGAGGYEDGKPTGLAARTAASLNATPPDQMDSGRSSPSIDADDMYSFPPLPPPGPIRTSASTANSNSGLSLKAQLKPHLLLPLPLSGAAPKLRSGREATFSFGSKGSPPASPTTYTPPVPGGVPGSPTGVGKRVGGSLENLPSFGAGRAGGHSLEDLTSYGKRAAAFGFTPTRPIPKPAAGPPAGLKITTQAPSPVELLPPFGNSTKATNVLQASPSSIASSELDADEERSKKESITVSSAPAPTHPSSPPTLSPSSPQRSPPTTIITGKKRGLSLSNYCPPTSPSLIKSPTSYGPAGVPSMQSLIPAIERSSDNSKGDSPVTPLGELRIVGGMPATFVDEAALAPPSVNPQRLGGGGGHMNRVGSWSGDGWIGMPDVSGMRTVRGGDDSPPSEKDEKVVSSSPPSKEDRQHAQLQVQELSGDSTLSTPDLERSPEHKAASSTSNEDDDDDDSVTDELDRKLMFTAAERRIRDAHDEEASGSRSDDSSCTATQTSTDSSSVPFPSASPTETRPSLGGGLSKLGRRMTSAAGVQMKLDMPTRQVFKEPTAEKTQIASPPKRGSPKKSQSRSTQQRHLSPPPAVGLGLNVTSPGTGTATGTNTSTTGPPPEFLAKYCFFVSSPATSPPLPSVASTLSPPRSNTGSPVGSGYTSPMMPGAFGTGVDTPKASSPGISGPAAWWGGSKTEKNGVSAGAL